MQHLKEVLNHGVNIEDSDNSQRTALFACVSAFSEATEKTALLIEAGASLEAKDNAEETALFEAAKSEDAAIIHHLIDAGAAVDVINAKGETPLFIAIRSNRPENVRSLLQAGAQPETKNANGRQAIEIALETQNAELVESDPAKNAVWLCLADGAPGQSQPAEVHVAVLLTNEGTIIQSRNSAGGASSRNS